MTAPDIIAAQIVAARRRRKRRRFVAALLAVVTLICAASAALAYIDGIVSEKGKNGATIAALASVPTGYPEDATLDALVDTEGDVDGRNVSAAKAALSLAPRGALERMLEEGWRVAVTSERDLAAYVDLGGATVNAVTVFDEKRIYVSASTDAEDVVLHELAHWMDKKAGWFSSGDEWEDAYEEEKAAIAATDPYAASSREEALAETVNALLLGREKYAAAAPRCAAVAKELVGMWESDG